MANKKKTEPKKMEKETKPVKKVAKKEIKNEKVEKVKKQEKLQPELIQGINMKIIVSIFIILLIVLIAFKMYKPKEEEKKQEENKPEVVEKVPLDENQIIAEYGMSKEDAIEIVKQNYNNPEEYTFSADINEDGMYVVNIYNVGTEKTNHFIVNPETKQYYEQ